MSRIDAMRQEMGGADPRAEKKVKDHLEPFVRGFIEKASFAVMASSNRGGDCDASPKGGIPGFIKVIDERTLLFPDVGGNRLFQTYQNFESNPKVGLVMMIPGVDATVRVNGRVEILDAAELDARRMKAETHMQDANSHLVQGILVHIDEAYFHCPRSMQFAKLWDSGFIADNCGQSLQQLVGQEKA